MERGTQLLQEKCDLLKKEIAEYEKGPKTVPASEHVLALQEARRKMATMVSVSNPKDRREIPSAGDTLRFLQSFLTLDWILSDRLRLTFAHLVVDCSTK
jgi:hypothetical protein